MTRKKTRKKNNFFLTKTTQKVLTTIGKPLYLAIYYLLIFALYIPNILGHIVNLIAAKARSARLPKVRIKVPQLKFTRKLIKQLLQTKKKKATGAKLKGKTRKKPIITFPQPQVFLPALGGALLIIFGVLSFSYWLVVIKDLPSPSELTDRKQNLSTKIYDRNGNLLYKIYKDENRTLVTLDQVPGHVRLATLAAEDAEFYNHPGFSVKGIARSVVKNIQEGRLTGGSTITQQLVKNALLSPEKTLTRKLREVILSLQVEASYSKDQILEMYLNEVSYGGTAYGIQEAAQVYFGKDVDALTVSEAAFLAGLPKSPTKFSPYGTNRELGYARQREVLHLMDVNKFITSEDRKDAESEKITLIPHKTDIKAPHFVMYVKEELVKKYGEEMVEQGGLEVVTTLDLAIQEMAQEVVSKEIDKLARLNVGNGAAVVMDPKSGEILAMVGSKDYFDTKNDGQVNVTTALRQPGSSIKVVNYAYALSAGFTPASILEDKPMVFTVAGQPPYTPKNYDNSFKGSMTLRSALAQSRNIPAVWLVSRYGVDKMLDLGKKMGITTWENPANYGLSLTLGGGEVKLLELTQVFATIAHYGERPDTVAIKAVRDAKGKVLEENAVGKSTPVLDPKVAYMLIDILKDNSARTPAFGGRSALVISRHPEVAVKTGTSNNLKDNLTVGFNQDYVVGVWVGNNDGREMARVSSGVTGAAPIWNGIMTKLLADEPGIAWSVPDGLVRLPICTLTGTLTCQGCPTVMEWFSKDSIPTRACSVQVIKKLKEEKERKEEATTPQAATSIYAF